MSKKIYYTGIGSKKSGFHTEEEFLNIMNKTFKEDCIDYRNNMKCKECKEYTRKMKKYAKQLAKSLNKNKTSKNKTSKNKTSKNKEKISNTMKIMKIIKNNKKLNELKNKCIKCKSNSNRTDCNLNEYIEYSGAEIKYEFPFGLAWN